MFTKNDVINLFSVIEEIRNLKIHPKFAYMISKNKKLIKAEMEIIREVSKPSDEIKKYDDERVALCTQYANSDVDGKPIIVKNSYQFTDENRVEFERELVDISARYDDALADHQKRMGELDIMMKEPCEIEFYKTSLDFFPDSLKQYQYDVLLCFVSE